jgi:YidC/Oxa1 family membrane protein insertase
MDIRKTLLWVVFSVSGIMLFNNWQIANGNKPLPFLAPPQKVENQAKTSSSSNLNQPPPLQTNSGMSAPEAQGSNILEENIKKITLKNDLFELVISTKGATVVGSSLKKHLENDEPIVLFNTDLKTLYLARSGLIAKGQELPTHNDIYTIKNQVNDQSVTLSSQKNGVILEKTFSLDPDSYVVTVKNKITNNSNTAITPELYNELVKEGTTKSESQFYSTFTGPAYFTEEHKYKEVQFTDIEKHKVDVPATINAGNPGWIAMAQHYFASAWIPSEEQNRDIYFDKLDNNLYRVGVKSSLPEIASGTSFVQDTKLFVGPEEESLLKNVAPGFEFIKDYGRLTIIAKPIFWLLTQIHKVVQNWGWAIIVLTILIKLAFFPLSAASYKSMARMKEVQPKLAQMKEQFKGDPQKLNSAMMELYKKEKINPLGGCLPVVIQIPVFISLYWVLLLSVEMRGAPWLAWIHDLSKPDTFISHFIGISTPIGILPIIMAISMFIQTKLNPAPPDPVQAKVMMFMPLAFSLMFFFFPSGLVLYYIVNNVLSIAQQWQINRMYGTKKSS